MSLPTVEADIPLLANICSTCATAGLAHTGISPFSIPSNKPFICVDTKASSGNPSIIPLCSSLKSASLSSKASGSLPISCISASDNPALLNCFLALVILDKLVPAFIAAVALAPSLILPTTLSAKAPSGISTSAPSIGATLSTCAACAIVASSDTSPVAKST